MNDFDKVATTSLDEWIEFLKTGKINDNTKAASLQETREQLRVDSLPTKERHAYDRYMESVRHMRCLFDTSREDGFLEEKKLGISTQQIIEATDLSQQEIEQLS